jgi:hypothetical protein
LSVTAPLSQSITPDDSIVRLWTNVSICNGCGKTWRPAHFDLDWFRHIHKTPRVTPLEMFVTLGLLVTGSALGTTLGYRYVTARSNWGLSPDRGSPETENPTPAPPPTEPVTALGRQLTSATAEAAEWQRRAALAATRVGDLERRLSSMTAEISHWKQRAFAAEAHVIDVSKGRSGAPATDHRFRQLRALLAKELHPDHVKTEGIESLVRAELFKALWPHVEEIERLAPR